MALSKQQIFGAVDLPRQEVEVPEWGGSVWVKMMTGAERMEFDEAILRDPDARYHARKYTILILYFTLCDEQGNRICTEESDKVDLALKNAEVLARIADAASDLNGTTARAQQELKKSSEQALNGASVSFLPGH